MTTMRGILRIVAIPVTGITVFYGLVFFVSFLMFDVLDVQNDQADLLDLVTEFVPFVVPPIGAVFAAIFVARVLRPKAADDRGFEVIPTAAPRDESRPSS